MAAKRKASSKAKAKSRKPSLRKPERTKAPRKKTTRAGASRKSTAKKTTAAERPVRRRAATSASPPAKKAPVVEPGPPPREIPPVEEPMQQEHAVGVVTHYYSHLGVAVVQVNTGSLRTGDTVHIKGHTTDITQVVGSMEYEHRHVDVAETGQSVGIKVFDHVREHDIVYLVR